MESDFGPYGSAYKVIQQTCEEYTKKFCNGLPFNFAPQSEIIKNLEIDPGLYFSQGNTWEGILNRMRSHEYIVFLEVHGLEERLIVPIVEDSNKK